MLRKAYDGVREFFDYEGRQRAARDARRAELLELQKQVDLAEAARHERTLELMEAVLGRVQATTTGTTEALTEIAKGVQENAKAFNRWMGLFEQHQAEGASHVVRPADEAEEADKRDRERLRAMFPGVFPEETPVDPYVAHLVANMFNNEDRG